MMKVFRIFVLLVLTTNVSCAKKVNVKWQGSEVKVDGDDTEWSVPLQFYDSKSKLNYVVTNDDKNLYFAFRITDTDVINQFNFGGITIEIDTIRGKKLNHMLRYPSGVRPMPMMDEEKQWPEEATDTDNGERRLPLEQMGRQQAFITLKAVCNYRKEVTKAIDELEGIEAAHQFDMDAQVLFCELKVPFHCLELHPQQRISPDNSFKIKFTLGNSSDGRPAPPQGGDHNLQGPPPGGGNPPMGGGPGSAGIGESRRHEGQGRPEMPNGNNANKQEIVFEFDLATRF